jgi:hypothetical protein
MIVFTRDITGLCSDVRTSHPDSWEGDSYGFCKLWSTSCMHHVPEVRGSFGTKKKPRDVMHLCLSGMLVPYLQLPNRQTIRVDAWCVPASCLTRDALIPSCRKKLTCCRYWYLGKPTQIFNYELAMIQKYKHFQCWCRKANPSATFELIWFMCLLL